MKKEFCDICNTDITNVDGIGIINLKALVFSSYFEICPHCQKTIRKLIKPLEK